MWLDIHAIFVHLKRKFLSILKKKILTNALEKAYCDAHSFSLYFPFCSFILLFSINILLKKKLFTIIKQNKRKKKIPFIRKQSYSNKCDLLKKNKNNNRNEKKYIMM